MGRDVAKPVPGRATQTDQQTGISPGKSSRTERLPPAKARATDLGPAGAFASQLGVADSDGGEKTDTKLAALMLEKAAAVSRRAWREAHKPEGANYRLDDVDTVASLLRRVRHLTRGSDHRVLRKSLDQAYVHSFRLTVRYGGGVESPVVDDARKALRMHFEAGGWSAPRPHQIDRRAPRPTKAGSQRIATRELKAATALLGAALRGSGTGNEDDDRREMRRVAEAAALSAEIAIENRSELTARERRRDTATIEAFGAALVELETWMRASGEKRLPVYGRLFAAENRLRRSVGLPARRGRAGDAKAIADELKKGKSKATSAPAASYPTRSAALEGIQRALVELFNSQKEGVKQAKHVVQEPPPEKVRGHWEILLDLALSLAITAGAAFIGHHVKSLVAMTARGMKYPGLADVAKDSSKMLVKRALKASVVGFGHRGGGLSEAAKSSDARTPLNVYFNGQVFLIDRARTTTVDQVIRQDLGQYDLPTLSMIAEGLLYAAGSAKIRLEQERATIREWVNFNARLNDPRLLRQGNRGKRDASTSSADAKNPIAPATGFLVIDLGVDPRLGTNPRVQLARMDAGTSHGAKNSLRASGVTVAKAKLNAIIRVRVSGSSQAVVLHRHPDSGRVSIDDSSFGGQAWLKAFEAKRYYKNGFSILDTAELAYLHRTYDRVHALKAARTLGRFAAKLSLSKLG